MRLYNNRWFLVANNKGFEGLTLYAIDRIEDMRETDRAFVPLAPDFDFDDWFGDEIEVMAPASLRQEMKEMAGRVAKMYGK